MNIQNVAAKIYYVLKESSLLSEEGKKKALEDILFSLKTKDIEYIINFPYKELEIIENEENFTSVEFIQMKALLHKSPFNEIILKRIGNLNHIYNEGVFLNLLDSKDIDFYIKENPDFLNTQIKKSGKSIIYYLFESNEYTSIDEALIIMRNYDSFINTENKEKILLFIKNNKEKLMNARNNHLFFGFLNDSMFADIFPEIKNDKNKFFELLKINPISNIDCKWINYLEKGNIENIEGSEVLKFFFDNEIPITKKNLMLTMKISDESKLPKLIEFEKFKYLENHPDVFSVLSQKHLSFGNKEDQEGFLRKILNFEFTAPNYTSSLIFLYKINDDFILSKKLDEFKMIIKLLTNKNFSVENALFIIKNLKEITLNEIHTSKLFLDKNLKYLSSITKANVSSKNIKERVNIFKSLYEQKLLLNEIFCNNENLNSNKKRI